MRSSGAQCHCCCCYASITSGANSKYDLLPFKAFTLYHVFVPMLSLNVCFSYDLFIVLHSLAFFVLCNLKVPRPVFSLYLATVCANVCVCVCVFLCAFLCAFLWTIYKTTSTYIFVPVLFACMLSYLYRLYPYLPFYSFCHHFLSYYISFFLT